MQAESRPRIVLRNYPHWFYLPAGIVFALFFLVPTVLAFYFSQVMDKLGRSASLVGLGLLFLLGGWLLEKTRRRLMERLQRGEP